jgi:hypothetical protein
MSIGWIFDTDYSFQEDGIMVGVLGTFAIGGGCPGWVACGGSKP